MNIAATGHRPDKLGGYGQDIADRLQAVAWDYLELKRPAFAISGMALGWDQAFALAALDLGIPLIAAVPFKGQEDRWPLESRHRYVSILARAIDVIYVSPPPYASWKLQMRNVWMVDKAQRMAALWDGSDGGTANCILAAHKAKTPVDNLWEQFTT